MKQRDVIDNQNVKWSCVQAYSGLKDESLEKAEEITAVDNNKVTVICTPTGGAQTVRIELNEDWLNEVSDEKLVAAIGEASK